jgi:hypothetical protein
MACVPDYLLIVFCAFSVLFLCIVCARVFVPILCDFALLHDALATCCILLPSLLVTTELAYTTYLP